VGGGTGNRLDLPAVPTSPSALRAGTSNGGADDHGLRGRRDRRIPAAGSTLGTITTILQNPRYTGRQVWNRQRTDTELADPGNVTLGHKSVQR
jgi:hypothetical protein